VPNNLGTGGSRNFRGGIRRSINDNDDLVRNGVTL
jgi:hypothetical protein